MKRGRNLFIVLLLVISLGFINVNLVNAETIEEPKTEGIIEQEENKEQNILPTQPLEIEAPNNSPVEEIPTTEEVVELLSTENNETEPEAGEVVAEKSAEVVTGEGEDGRSADVTIEVAGTSFTEYTQEEREIVLVLDDSGSMDYAISSTDKTVRLTALKEAARGLINSLLAQENAGKVKVGIVYYGSHVTGTCALTTDKDELMVCLNAMNGNGGTNVQAGLRDAKTLFTSSTTSSKTIMLLTDGEPTFYEDEPTGNQTQGTLHGMGNADEYEDTDHYTDSNEVYTGTGLSRYRKSFTRTYYLESQKRTIVKTCEYSRNSRQSDWERTCTTSDNVKKPSEAAIDEIADFKNTESDINGTVYTVGFAIEAESAAEDFLKEVATKDAEGNSKYYLATSLENLIEIFKAIENDISLIATNVKVVDTIPNKFKIDTEYFETNFGTATTQEDGSIKYGDSIIVKNNDNGSTTLTWLIGDLKSTNPKTLTFRIDAQADYYGNLFTNDGAKVTGTAVSGNPFYTETNPLSIDLVDPTVAIPAVTFNDSYTVNQGETLTTTKATGVRKNDYASVQTDNNATVVDEVIKVLNVTKGTLTLNKDGSFTYVAPTNYYGNVTFTYYIETSVKVGEETFVVKSNTSTGTITINRIPTTYVVHHYIEGTTTKVENTPDDTGNGYVYETATGYAKTNLTNYELVTGAPTSQTINLKASNNVMTFYYQLKQGGKVTVHHYIKGTTEKLAADEEKTGKVTQSYTTSAKTFDNYELVATPSNANGTFTLTPQEVTYYYQLKQGGKVTVYYYEDKTTNVLAKTEELTGKVTETYISVAKTVPNWNLIATPSNATGTFTLSPQTVIYYYSKIMGTVITHHVDEEGKTVSKDVTTTGQQGSRYTTSAATDIDENYELKTTPSNATGTYTNGTIEVTYVYGLKQGGKVTVYYYEEGTTNVLAKTEELTGKVTEAYKSVEKDVTNYELVATPTNAEGKFTLEEQTVIYYYKKLMGKVIAKYVDENGKPLANPIETTGQVETDYVTKAQEFTNYKLVRVDGKEEGQYTIEDIEVTYVYKYVGDIVDTGVIDNNFPEIFFMIMSVMLTGAILLKKRYN